MQLMSHFVQLGTQSDRHPMCGPEGRGGGVGTFFGKIRWNFGWAGGKKGRGEAGKGK